ncbi:MAG: glycosyltransferase [Deltaproteobacteria bacterium]
MSIEFVTADRISRRSPFPGFRDVPEPEEILASKREGLPVPRLHGKTIHSMIDPREEARRFLDRACQQAGLREGDPVILLGNGFGYFAESALERGLRPVVFEPCRELFRGFVEHRDPAPLLGSVPFFLLEDPADLYRSGSHRKYLESETAVLALPYLSWLRPGFAEGVERTAKAIRDADGAIYRVSVVSPLCGGSWEISKYAANGFRAAGYPVDFVDVSGFGAVPDALRAYHAGGDHAALSRALQEFYTWCSAQILERVERFDSAVVFVLAQAPLDPEHLRKMRDDGRRVVFWFVEDHRLFRYWEETAARYDLFFRIQKGAFPRELSQAGQMRSHYLPPAADETIFHPGPLSEEDADTYGSPLSFLGAGYYNRRRFFNLLLSRPFKIWGTGWPQNEPLYRHVQKGGKRVDSLEASKIFRGTQVNLNLHSSTSHEGVNPFGDFVNPRTFEIAACSAFQLVDHRSLLPDLFLPGEEIVCFSGREDFLEQVDHYLSRPEERSAFGAAGRERVLREHTYRDRMREAMEAIHEMCPPDRARRLSTVSELIGEEADPQWRRLLESLPPNLVPDLGTVASEIRSMDPGKALSKKEAMVLLLERIRDGAR